MEMYFDRLREVVKEYGGEIVLKISAERETLGYKKATKGKAFPPFVGKYMRMKLCQNPNDDAVVARMLAQDCDAAIRETDRDADDQQAV